MKDLIVKRLNRVLMNQRRKRKAGIPFFYSDVRFISFGRSGREWIENITLMIMYELGYVKYQGMFMFKHDGTLPKVIPKDPDGFIKDKSYYKDNRVIFMVREPRDVVVSLHYCLAYRLGYINPSVTTLHDFLHSECGLSLVVRFMNTWSVQRDIPIDFMLLRYEDAVDDILSFIYKILEFVKLEVSASLVQRCIAHCGIEQSRKFEVKYSNSRLFKRARQVKLSNMPHSYHARVGGYGKYVSELSQEDLEWSTQYLIDNLDPYYWFYPMDAPRKAL
jgi:hypothetical protein